MARIKETVNLKGDKGTRRISGRGKSYSRPMSDDEVKRKHQKNNAMVFGGLAGGNTVRTGSHSSTTGRKVKYYTGGGF